MHGNWCKRILGMLTAVTAAGSAQVSVFAKEIPLTGDASGILLPAMGGLLGVSAILLIVYLVLSKKKK